MHNHVLRTYLTEPTGDKIEVKDGKYTANFAYRVPSAWDADKMTVVAFVSKYLPQVDADNVFDADIVNAQSAPLSGGQSNGISSVAVDAAAADGVYTLGGMRVDGGTKVKGIYIVRKGGVTREVIVK